MRKNVLRSIAMPLLICIIASTFIACGTNSVTTSNNQGKASSSGDAQKPNVSNNNPSASPANNENQLNNASKKKVKAKGLYLTATSAGAKLKHYIDLANTTEINSYVIDYKNDYGEVCVDSQVPIAKEIGAVDVRYDAKKVVKELHDNNIYAIARIVVFKDPILAKKKPEFSIKNTSGDLYIHNKMAWVNPYNKEAWKYSIDLAKEALAAGFDEVQFDYIRFPDGKKSQMVFGDTGNKKLEEVVNEYLAETRKQLPNAIISGDVFAIICESPGDTEGIGQVWEKVGKDLDYIYPMAYPSHYALGQIVNGVKFPKPDKDPYGVIKQTFSKAKNRMEKVEGNKPGVRAYLQDFTATWIGSGNWQYYEDEQIRQQIQGLYDAGYEEWFLWDPMNNYREGAFKKE